jgi:hypothetical protein
MDDLAFLELEAIPSTKDADFHGDVIESIALPTLNHSVKSSAEPVCDFVV